MEVIDGKATCDASALTPDRRNGPSFHPQTRTGALIGVADDEHGVVFISCHLELSIVPIVSSEALKLADRPNKEINMRMSGAKNSLLMACGSRKS